MSDDKNGTVLPPVYELPSAAIDNWIRLNPSQNLRVEFSRYDLDNLMMGLRQSIASQMALADALQAASINDVAKSNEHFERHRVNVREAYSNFNRFIEHVMTHAQQEPDNGR
ncbi:hypothetical protein [Bosea sp. (in: a-proteobacteria)]|uniref:hypothetical protein n=1 Tax=Bosea sp. (in: a-proteobacteria) TaxID=1871050 RepID=UPI0025C692A9|nr:hypothetical protein [Bosea sp. (in: a-proteobacteria)]